MSKEPQLEHFGLREPPFLLAPDPEFLYLSTQHSLAQAYLSYALLNRDSFVVLTGETGTGKTTLINKLVANAGHRISVARIAHSQLTPVELLQSLLLSVGIRAFDKQKVELLTMLEDYINEQHEQRRQVLIVVDDAHNLAVDVLEEIRLVTQLGVRKDAAVNLILSGRPSLYETLELPLLAQLRQRMRFNFQLKPLTQEETGEYIDRRLEVAGAERPLFAAGCVPTIVAYTGGIPRLINILCDTALMTAFTEGADEVTPETLQAALDELDWRPFPVPRAATAPAPPPPEAEADADAEAEDAATHGPDDAGALGGQKLERVAAAARDVEREDAAADGAIHRIAAGRRRSPRTAAGTGGTAAAVHATLELFDGDAPVARHQLTGDRLTIGRDADNDIRIGAEYVSRHHAQVSWLRGGCWIADLNSTNGTFVNGLRVRRRLLRDGDEIQFGRHRLRVRCGAPSAEAVDADGDESWRETLVVSEERARKA